VLDPLVPLDRAWVRAADAAIGKLTEPLAAALLAAEVVILSAGVVARYALHAPLVWSDELASVLFLWFTMLGAVVAYRRRSHIRLSAFCNSLPQRAQAVLAIVVEMVVILFVLELLPASREYLVQEAIDLTPALSIPRPFVLSAIVVGLALIACLAFLRLANAPVRQLAWAIPGMIFVALAGLALHGGFMALGNANLPLFFVVVLGAGVAIGVPIAFAFGFATLSYLLLTTSVPLSVVMGRMDEGIENFILLAIPLFILLGLLIENAGIARRLVDAIASLVGHLRGGLSVVLLGSMYVVSGISGSKIADMAAVAPVLFPEMERRGQSRGEMVALLAASGGMAETIPPSLVLIVVASVTGISTSALFSAGLAPATVAALILVAIALARSGSDRVELAARPSARAIARAFLVAIPAFVLPIIIRAAVLSGIATATEVSTVGIVYTIAVGVLVYREFHWDRVYSILRETTALSGAIMFIVATATAMAWALTQSGFAQQLTTMLAGAPGGAFGFWAIAIVAFIILGSILEGVPALVLFGPLIFPIAAQFHIPEVQFAIVAILAMGIGLFSPPLGFGYYSACAIGKSEPDANVKRMVPYLAGLLLATIIVAAVPFLTVGFAPPGRP
jgi:tripartite ATP-independent transporter DctM subunit